MKAPEIGLWGRLWPVWLISLIGLWPLAGHIDAQLAQADLPAAAAGGATPILALALAQSAALLFIASAIGAAFAHRLGLVSLLAHRLEARRLWKELPLAVALGAILGVVLMLLDLWVFMPLIPEAAAANRPLSGSPEQALLLGMLYGGISEEVMMRWGVMTLICWIGMRLMCAPSSQMPGWIAWSGIVLSAIFFALGHLPAAMHHQALDAIAAIRILGLNAIAGVVFGWIYWKRSLESAIAAHAAVHASFYLLIIR